MHSPAPNSRESAHRNRPLRYDGRVVVTLCAEEILYLPVTTEIAIVERGEAVTSRALAAAAHISLNTACTWLRQRETGAMESKASLSVLQYTSYSTADNTPAVEKSACAEAQECAPAGAAPPTAAPAPPDMGPISPARPAICPAASHQLLWRWRAGSWQCPACGG
jgi:hypothetical protein